MKKGLIFATTLAMALGVGVAVGAHQGKAVEVKADGEKVVYCKVDKSWWTADNAAVGAYYWGGTGGPSWPGLRMTSVETDPTVWKITIPSGHSSVIFTRVNPTGNIADWGAKTDDLTIPTDSKNLFVITQETGAWDGAKSAGSWQNETYVEPTVASVYKYSLNGGTAVEMSKGTGTEYVSAELDFAKGDVVSFTKDSVAYAVEPKNSGQQTKVYAVTGGLKFAEAYHGVLYLDTNGAVLWAGQFTPGYYLASSKTGWEPKLGTPAELETGENPAWKVENLELNANDGVKLVNFPVEGNTVTWYDVTYENEQPRVYTSSKVQFSVDGDRNLVVANTGTYNVYYNTTSGWYSIEDVNYTPDVPANDGYYLISSLTDYKYAGATPMPSVDPSTGNVAVLVGYDPEPGEKVKVRSYFSGEDKYSANVDVDKDYGEVDEEFNFVFADDIGQDDTFDIYAFYDGSSFLFSVAPHAERVTVSIVAKQYAGNHYQGETSVLYRDEDVIKGQTFTVPDVTPEGYVALGVYSDFNCTTPFISGETVVESTILLHVKVMELGWYLAGGEDETFSVETATKLGTSAGNKCTGAVVAPEGTSALNPYVVKPLEYVADKGDGNPGWAAVTYKMGHEEVPAFVHIDGDGNFAFTVPGTYAFYVNNEDKVWFNGGEYAYIEKFLSDTELYCDAQGKSSDLDGLQEAWEILEDGFKALGEEEIKDIKDVGFNGGNKDSEDAKLRMVARYAYIVSKYGTAMFNDFIWSQNLEAQQSVGRMAFDSISNNNTMIIVISIAAVSALAFTTLLVFKKRKQK